MSQVSALDCIRRRDRAGLTSLLAEVCPLDDDQQGAEAGMLPLAPDHWINTPLGRGGEYKTLLQLALEAGAPGTELVRILVTAGARTDLHNEDLGVSPVHVAAETDNIAAMKLLTGGEKNRANINNMMRNGRTALHIAAERGNTEMMRLLLETKDLETVDAEDLMGRQTPVSLAAKHGKLDAVKLLLEHGASLRNTVEGKSLAEYLTEKFPQFNPHSVTVKVKPKVSSEIDILYSAAKLLDKAQISKRRNETNAQNLMFFKTLIQSVAANNLRLLDTYNSAGMTLLQKSCDYGLEKFAEVLLGFGVDANQTSEETKTKPVLFAAYSGHSETLRVLLEHKKECDEKRKAARFDVQEGASKETVLHHVLKMPRKIDGPLRLQGYKECLQLLFEDYNSSVEAELKKIINKKDIEGNSALHYATQNWPQETTRRLLEAGANIGLKNKWDETPISKIRPETMEDFLDDYCLRSKNDVHQEDFELEFNYSFIAPPVDNPYFDETDPEGQEMVENQGYPETETLWYMAQSKGHRHLLKHPVITSFLWLKWQRIRKQFNRNLRLYLLFVTTLTWYIVERFGGVSRRNSPTNSGVNDTGEAVSFCSTSHLGLDKTVGLCYVIFLLQALFQFVLIFRDWRRDLKESDCGIAVQVFFTSWLEYLIITIVIVILIFQTSAMFICLSILLALVLFREFLQMMVSLKRYIFGWENWMEILTVILAAIILYVPDEKFESPCETKRHLAAFCIILSWSTLITLVGRHPKLAQYNIYVTMFYKILETFVTFLVWYSFFIIAFSLGFYIMLHKDTTSPSRANGASEQDGEYVFFNNPWWSLVKTSTMFVGEIEFSDIPIDLENGLWPLGYIFLLSFIFLIGKNKHFGNGSYLLHFWVI